MESVYKFFINDNAENKTTVKYTNAHKKEMEELSQKIAILRSQLSHIEENEDLQRALKRSLEEQSMGSPLQNPADKSFSPAYLQKKQAVFKKYVDSLKTYQFTEKFQKDGKRNHIVIGKISSGKTSLINRYLNLELKVARGQQTTVATRVASNEKVNVIDSPGDNEEFSFYDYTTLDLFFSSDRVFVCYDTCLKDIKQILKVLKEIKPKNIYLFRTKCDLFNGNDSKSIEEEIETDYAYLMSQGLSGFKILATSSERNDDFYSNYDAKKLLIGEF